MFHRMEHQLSCRDQLKIRLKAVTEPLRSQSIHDKVKRLTDEVGFSYHFKRAMQSIEQIEQYAKEQEVDAVETFSYMLDMVKNDIKYDCLSEVLYAVENELTGFSPFPHYFYNEAGQREFVETKEEEKTIDLADDCVFSIPWNTKRLVGNANHLNGVQWKYHASNHLAYYYPQLDLCYVYNGNHSVAIGIHKKEGWIRATVVDLDRLFTNISTDGVFWYCIHTGAKLSGVADFRFAVLFELVKKRDCVKNAS